jgi:hypothetical protein
VSNATLGTVFIEQVADVSPIASSTGPIVTRNGVIDLLLCIALFFLNALYHDSLLANKELVFSESQAVSLPSALGLRERELGPSELGLASRVLEIGNLSALIDID